MMSGGLARRRWKRGMDEFCCYWRNRGERIEKGRKVFKYPTDCASEPKLKAKTSRVEEEARAKEVTSFLRGEEKQKNTETFK